MNISLPNANHFGIRSSMPNNIDPFHINLTEIDGV